MRTIPARIFVLAVLVVVFLAPLAMPQDDGVSARVGEQEFRITFGEIFTILSIGGLVSALVGVLALVRGKTISAPRNLAIGVFGAIVGGFLVDWIDIDLGFGDFCISYEQLFASYAGAILLLLAIAIGRRSRARRR
jgi:uncharacterized membrane protein YeaQ/YmgE (transglycosylase-associated protein family)